VTTDCTCLTPPFSVRDFSDNLVGVDTKNGRFGDVSIQTCRHCGSTWLHYRVEYEAFSRSGRWFRGPITPELSITAENAVDVLADMPWYFFGGSYFESTGRRGFGPPRVDL
jgi:hypothetical protein